MFRCFHGLGKKGSLLLEVLISTALLVVGLLACLRVFSASSYSSQRLQTDEKIINATRELSFSWFLNPADFSSAATENMSSRDSALEKKVQVTLLPRLTDETDQNKRQNPLAMLNSTSLKFYEINFTMRPDKKRSQYEQKFYVFRYGNESA